MLIAYIPILYFILLGFLIRKKIVQNDYNFSTYLFSIILCTLKLIMILFPINIIFIFILTAFLSSDMNSNSTSIINIIMKILGFPQIIFSLGFTSIAIYKINGDYNIRDAFYIFKKPIFAKSFFIVLITYLFPTIIHLVTLNYNNSFLFYSLICLEHISTLVIFYFTLFLIDYLNQKYAR